MTASPKAARRTASSASNTARPLAAPGLAGRPVAIGVARTLGSMMGCSSWSSWSAGTRTTASRLEIIPSATISVAMRTAAAVVRFPVRVCSRNSLPRSTVNSMSCMSQ